MQRIERAIGRSLFARSRSGYLPTEMALPEHPSMVWRKQRLPKAVPRYRVSSILSVMELVAPGMGVGIVPLFLAEGRDDLIRLSEPLDECDTELWLLTYPESRHLRRIAAAYGHLVEAIRLV